MQFNPVLTDDSMKSKHIQPSINLNPKITIAIAE